MKHLYIFRIYDTGKDDRHCDTKLLQEKIKGRLGVAADWITRHEYMGYNSYVLIGYERVNELKEAEFSRLFESVTNEIGNLSDDIGYELKIEFLPAVTSTVVTPDALLKPKGEEASKKEEDDEDEWAEVKRLRDLAKH